VQDQPKIAINSDGNSLSDSPKFAHFSSFYLAQWWIDSAEQKRTREAHVFERLTNDTRLKRSNVSGDIRQLRHDIEITARGRQGKIENQTPDATYGSRACPSAQSRVQFFSIAEMELKK
jgi:hypothetical protein